MADSGKADGQADEIVFSARYSALRVWITIIIAFVPIMVIGFGAAYSCLQKDDYWGTVAFSLIGSAGVLLCVDVILLKGIAIYSDRVTKFWYPFGSRSVSYSRGMAQRAPYQLPFPTPHFIVEVRKNGKPFRMRLAIMYIPFCFRSDTAKKIERIMDYLSEDKSYYERRFKKSILHKGVVHQEP